MITVGDLVCVRDLHRRARVESVSRVPEGRVVYAVRLLDKGELSYLRTSDWLVPERSAVAKEGSSHV